MSERTVFGTDPYFSTILIDLLYSGVTSRAMVMPEEVWLFLAPWFAYRTRLLSYSKMISSDNWRRRLTYTVCQVPMRFINDSVRTAL
ncbi:hypothetical protein ACFL45_08205 [Candidatus Neomarinimicrobiota bacterium]